MLDLTRQDRTVISSSSQISQPVKSHRTQDRRVHELLHACLQTATAIVPKLLKKALSHLGLAFGLVEIKPVDDFDHGEVCGNAGAITGGRRCIHLK
jgi:hypothetical protein